MLWIRQRIDVIDAELITTAGNLAGSDDPWAGTLSADQHWQGIVQNIAGGQMAPEVSLCREGRVEALSR